MILQACCVQGKINSNISKFFSLYSCNISIGLQCSIQSALENDCSNACLTDREMAGVTFLLTSCQQILLQLSVNIMENVRKYYGNCKKIVWQMSENIMATVSKNYDLHFHVLTEVQHCNSI